MNKWLFVMQGGGNMKPERKDIENPLFERFANNSGKDELNLTMLNLAKFPEARNQRTADYREYIDGRINNVRNDIKVNVDQIFDPAAISEGELDDVLGKTDIIHIWGWRPVLLLEHLADANSKLINKNNTLTPELVAKMLEQYEKNATSIYGSSAWAAVWGENLFVGLDEPLTFDGKRYEKWDELFLPALWFVDGNIVAHFSSRAGRHEKLEKQVLDTKKVWYGFDEHTALVIDGDNYETLSGGEQYENWDIAGVHRYSLDPENKEKVVKELLVRWKIANRF